MIMFGGKIPRNDYADDVWVLQGANGLYGTPAWIQLTPGTRGPLGRHDHTAVYDQRNNRMIVFGGHTAFGFAADVWVLRNANGLAVGQDIFGQRGGLNGRLAPISLAVPSWVQLNPMGRRPAEREWHGIPLYMTPLPIDAGSCREFQFYRSGSAFAGVVCRSL